MRKFKKVLAGFSVLILLTLGCISAAGLENSNYERIVYSPYSDYAEGINNTDNVSVQASGIISSYVLTLYKSNSNTLTVRGQTTSANICSKIGFTYIRLQKYVNGSWQNYASWTDLYNTESVVYTAAKSVAVTSGTYRAVCEHYGEQKILLIIPKTEKIYNETTSLVI